MYLCLFPLLKVYVRPDRLRTVQLYRTVPPGGSKRLRECQHDTVTVGRVMDQLEEISSQTNDTHFLAYDCTVLRCCTILIFDAPQFSYKDLSPHPLTAHMHIIDLGHSSTPRCLKKRCLQTKHKLQVECSIII